MLHSACRRNARCAGVIIVLGLLLAATPALATRLYTINVPATLGRSLAAARRGPVPVLLPSRLVAGVRRAYPSGGATRRGYSLSLGAAPNCNDATACFLAYFSATRGGRLVGGNPVALTGRVGRFYDLSCGASCSPPQVAWVEHGVLYGIQANVETNRLRQALVALANSAITAGPR
jgi:hypothetical protein